MYLSKWKRAFTLLEMLVVVTIIMLLSSMLLVSFGKFRAKAREVQCLNNMKNLHGMVLLASGDWLDGASTTVYGYYDKDNSDGLWDWHPGWINRFGITGAQSNDVPGAKPKWPSVPPNLPGDPAPWDGPDAEAAIRSGNLYKKTKFRMRILVCPEFLIKMKAGGHDAKRSYSMNSQLHGRKYKDISAGRLAEDAPEKAGRGFSSYLMFGEMAITNMIDGVRTCERAIGDGGPNEDLAGDAVLTGIPHDTASYPVETLGSYHANGRANAVFLDGHAEKIHRSETTNVCAGIR